MTSLEDSETLSFITELFDDLFEDKIVRQIDVIINAVAINQVSLVRAEAADLPETKPLLFPPIPRPPPSERCSNTIPTSKMAKIRCIVKITFGITKIGSLLSSGKPRTKTSEIILPICFGWKLLNYF